MNLPKPQPFSRDIEARFPVEESVPEDMKEWWVETRENLERLKDKITALSLENESLKQAIASIGSEQQFTVTQAQQLARFIQFWNIQADGSLVPRTHNASDIGSAEFKVRDIYEHDA